MPLIRSSCVYEFTKDGRERRIACKSTNGGEAAVIIRHSDPWAAIQNRAYNRRVTLICK